MKRFRMLCVIYAVSCGAGFAAAPAACSPAIIDPFESLSSWSAHPADGTELAIRSDAGFAGRAMRLDFRFLKGGGYVIARRELSLPLPANYAFSFRIKGDAPPEHLEFKLVDSTGANVWWSVRRDVEWPKEWQTFRIKKRQISFAWGPAGGGELRRAAALEIAVTAGSGGEGSVWLDDLELTELPPPDAVPPAPVLSASSAAKGGEAANAADGDSATAWSPREGEREPWIALDFQTLREFGGLTMLWAPGRHAAGYDVESSEDGRAWTLLRAVRGGNGGSDHLYLPESETRHLRVRVLGGGVAGSAAGAAGGAAGTSAGGAAGAPAGHAAGAPALEEILVRPLEWSSSRSAFFEAIAKEAPRGCYPRSFTGEQIYWTVTGVDHDAEDALLSEDGALEVGRGAFSIEPFLFVDGKLVTWADAKAQQSLSLGFAPVPRVILSAPGLDFGVDAFGTGDPGASSLVARYFVWSRDSQAKTKGTLYLAIRPLQVNPPSQSLNLSGGASRIGRIESDGGTIRVDGRRVVSLTKPDGFGAVAFDGGEIVTDFLREGRLPEAARTEDPFGAASGALAYGFELSGRDPFVVDVVIPFYDAVPAPTLGAMDTPRDWTDLRLRAAGDAWSDATGRVGLRLPQGLGDLMRSQLGYVLVNRAGPAIQPGTRSYARSWIRDGALTCSVLLRLGRPEPVREFIEWFAPNQYSNGKIPCVVDARGADPVPEHDSSGEFIFLVAEYYRYTKDRAFTESLWPRVAAASAYLDSLRQTRRTEGYRAWEKRQFFGLLPESISHEGYSAKPMHSYWDDFFAARGFRDAVFLAGELGRREEAAKLAAIRDEFERDLRASIDHTREVFPIVYIPGCADQGDFDATSTAIGVSPLDLLDLLPADRLQSTIDKYMEFFRGRRDGDPWDAFTPYETRIIGSLVRLGRPADAHDLLKWFLGFQRPRGWNHWAEVVGKDERAPRFIGDMPHTWVGTEFARSILDMLAFDRERDSTLVIAAGVSAEWARQGVAVKDLPTRYGTLSYEMSESPNGVLVKIRGALEIPAGGLLVHGPFNALIRSAEVNGRREPLREGGAVLVRKLPAEVEFRR